MISWLSIGTLCAAAPKVVASIEPVHSLVAGVMEGVGTPTLLLKGAVSPHDYALRPSDAAALAGADIVFWIGAPLEGFLEKPLKANKTRQVALIDAASVRYPAREGGVWEAHEHDEHDHDGHDHEHEGHEHDAQGHDHGAHAIDPHVWLDPINATDMVNVIAHALIALDAENKTRYEANAAALRQRLTALDDELVKTLAPVKKAPFIVFHDGYQYFEKHYGLNGAGSITVNPEQKPSAQRLQVLRDKVQKNGVACVFAEPQYSDGLVKSIVEGTKARSSVVDPLGSNIAPGADAYFSMMRRLGENVRRCLGAT